MYGYTKSPAEKARATRLVNLCELLCTGLQHIATSHGCGETSMVHTVALFSAHKGRADLGDAFQTLDERPSHFGNGDHCQAWHQVLRCTRNSRVYGPKMFAVWSNE